MQLYIKIYNSIKDDIINGIYAFGDRLPSKRTTSDDYGVSLVTVEHAYELLTEEGYIVPRERSGYYVNYTASDFYGSPIQEVPAQIASIPLPVTGQDRGEISFAIYSKAARKVMSTYGDEVLAGSPGAGTFRLREVLAGYLSRNRGIHTDADHIIVGSGAEYLYGLIIKLLGREKKYGIESPSYNKIQKVYEAEGITPLMLSLGNDGIRSEDLWKSGAEVLHISPYRSFPSGVTASASKKNEYLRFSNLQNAYIIEDDYESEFTPSRKSVDTLLALNGADRVIYINTFTKTLSKALRTAYMIIPDSLMADYEKKLSFYSCPVPTLEQYIIAELIENGSFERHINRIRRINRSH